MARDLLDCPLEVLLNISSRLDTPEYGNLRRSCSMIEKLLFDTFAKEFFTVKQFMITSFSLQTLVDISKHSTLSPYLERVIIGLDRVSRGLPTPGANPLIATIHSLFDQESLISTGAIHMFLKQAFQKLPNCHSVEIRDFESKTRKRDNRPWRSYGKKSVQDLGGFVGYSPTVFQPRHAHLKVQTIFNQLTQAIVESDLISCRSLSLINRFDDNALPGAAFYIPSCSIDSYARVLANITTFQVGLSKNPESTDRKEFERFLTFMPHLATLRVNGDSNTGGMVSAKEECYYIAPLKSYLLTAPIKRFELGKMDIEHSQLRDLLATLQHKVEVMSFYRVSLEHGSWLSILNAARSMPCLGFLQLRNIRQSRTARLHDVGFKASGDQRDAPFELEPFIECQASWLPDFQTKLSNTAARLVVKDEEWSKKHFPPESKSSEGEDDAEEGGYSDEDEPMDDTIISELEDEDDLDEEE